MVKLSVCPVGRAAALGLRGLRSMTRASGRDLQLGPIPQPPLIPGALAFLCHRTLLQRDLIRMQASCTELPLVRISSHHWGMSSGILHLPFNTRQAQLHISPVLLPPEVLQVPQRTRGSQARFRTELRLSEASGDMVPTLGPC